jgi:hypothetical protein
MGRRGNNVGTGSKPYMTRDIQRLPEIQQIITLNSYILCSKNI